MQVFRAFFKIAKKRLGAAGLYFAIYVFITLILSFTAKDSIADNFKSVSLTIFIQDEDQTPASIALSSYLASIHNIAELKNEDEVLADQMYYRTLDYVLTIPEGFQENLAAGKTKQLFTNVKLPGSSTGYFIDQQISQYTRALQLYLTAGYSLSEAIVETDASIAAAPSVNLVTFQNEGSGLGSQLFSFYQYLPYIFIAILFSGMAPILVTLNQQSMRERTACSSLTAGSRNLQLTAGCIIYALAIWFLFQLASFLCYGMDIFTVNGLLGMLNSFVFLLFAASMTLLISCFVPDDNILNMAANMIGLSMAFLCGVFVPQFMLPEAVLNISRFLPAYWFIRANNMLGGLGNEVFDMNFYQICIGIQLLFAVAVLCVTFMVSRQKRAK